MILIGNLEVLPWETWEDYKFWGLWLSRGDCGIVCSYEKASLFMLRFASGDNFSFAPARGFEYYGNRRSSPLQLRLNHHHDDHPAAARLAGWGKECEGNGHGVSLDGEEGRAFFSRTRPLTARLGFQF